jgi:predicted permease
VIVLDRITRDVRHAWRTIARMPLLAFVVVASLGVGIGVNVVVFSWLQLLVFKPIPGVADAAGFHLVEPRSEAGTYPGGSWPEYQDLRDRLRAFRSLVAFRMAPFNVGEPGRTERTFGQLVSGNYFAELGLRPQLGRFLNPDEVTRAGAAPVVVLSHKYWRTRFNSSPEVLNQTIRVNGNPLTIVGVGPEGFQGTVMGLDFDLFVPATLAPVLFGAASELDNRNSRGYSMIARLRPGASLAVARADLEAAMRELAEAWPQSNATISGEVLPFWQATRGPQRMLAQALTVLQGIMLLLLLAVCGNTANLVLARASTRQREIGVRLALGARPRRILSLLLTESVLLGLAGAAVGAAVAVWGTEALRAVPFIGALPIRFQTSVDGTGLALAMLLGVASALAFGLTPAIQLARVDPIRALRTGARTASRSPMRNALMGTQVGLALVVLIVAGLFYRSFREAQDVDPGFTRDGVLLTAYDFSGNNPDAAASRAFAARLLERLRALPGVEAAAVAAFVPLDIHGMPLATFTLDGHARDDGAEDEALRNVVTPNYFRAMGIPLRAGRDFVDLNDPSAGLEAIVNEEFVRRFVGSAEPIGRRLQTRGREYSIVGVVRNSLYESFGEPATPIIYFSYRDRPSARGEIHLRTRTGIESPLASQVQRVVRDLDPTLPVYDVRTLTEHIEKNLFLKRIPARMFVVLGPMLLALAAIGIYAVVAYAVAHRTAEIGLRLSIGATRARVIAQIVGESLQVIGVGALAGWLLALGIGLHVDPGKPIDGVVFMGVPIVLMVVATVACWLPAARASKINPMDALRSE